MQQMDAIISTECILANINLPRLHKATASISSFLYLFRDSPPAHILILDNADLGVAGLAALLLSGPAVGEPVKLLLGEAEPELVR